MVLIVGMARSGIAAARLLHSRGQSVFATDSGEAPLRSELDSLGIPYETGGHSQARFLEAEENLVDAVPADPEIVDRDAREVSRELLRDSRLHRCHALDE